MKQVSSTTVTPTWMPQEAVPPTGRGCPTCGYVPTDGTCVVGPCEPGFHTLALVVADPWSNDPDRTTRRGLL